MGHRRRVSAAGGDLPARARIHRERPIGDVSSAAQIAAATSLHNLTLQYAYSNRAVDLLEPLREFAAWLPYLARITLCAAQRSGEDLQTLMTEIDRWQWPFAIIIK
jgi:hypothetical protein